jgi:hypothetical protein
MSFQLFAKGNRMEQINSSKFRSFVIILFSLCITAAMFYGVYRAVLILWNNVALLDPKTSTGILTAAGTVFAATITVMAGKHYESKKEREAAFRDKKILIYDEFLERFFRLFVENSPETQGEDMSHFMMQWQRKFILWGGDEVLNKYISWLELLRSGEPTVQAMFKMEEFFLEFRKDLGHQNKKLPQGTFIRLLWRNPEIFLAAAKINPNMTLKEVAEFENSIIGNNLN